MCTPRLVMFACTMTDVLMRPDVPKDPALMDTLQRRGCVLYFLILVGLTFHEELFSCWSLFVLFGSTTTANGEIHHWFEITSCALKQKITNKVSTVSPRLNGEQMRTSASPLVIVHISTLSQTMICLYQCLICKSCMSVFVTLKELEESEIKLKEINLLDLTLKMTCVGVHLVQLNNIFGSHKTIYFRTDGFTWAHFFFCEFFFLQCWDSIKSPKL